LTSNTTEPNRQRLSNLWRFFLAATVIFGTASCLPAQTAPQVAARVDRHYNALHSLEVHFVQTYTGMGMNRKESGVLLLKKPGKMRWTYTDPDGKLFVLDGKNGYFYSPGASEAQKVDQKKLDDLRSPLRFLLGHTELEKELTGLHVTCTGNSTCELSGIPKGLEQRVSSLKIVAATDGTIQSMTIDETDGVSNRFEFSGEAGNVPASDTNFVFVPPPGVHVVEGEPPV
jgi:outer membrane lipoprotein carrier protein